MSERDGGGAFSGGSGQREDDYSDVVSLAAHDARNHAALILGNSGYLLRLLQQTNPPDPAVVNCAQVIRRQASFLGNLLNDLSLDQREMTVNPKPLDITPLLRSVALDMTLCSDIHNFVVMAPDRLSQVMADKQRVEQVLNNLLMNAVKYSPGGGDIEIKGAEEGDWVKVAITDHGLGIPPEERENIFKRYYRVGEIREKVKGVGLGLSIVRRIIDAHNGRVWVESEGVNMGSTFCFAIPKIENDMSRRWG